MRWQTLVQLVIFSFVTLERDPEFLVDEATLSVESYAACLTKHHFRYLVLHMLQISVNHLNCSKFNYSRKL